MGAADMSTDKQRRYDRTKYLANKAVIISRSKAYWAANPEKQKTALKKFRDKDPAAYRKYQREWAAQERLKHPERVKSRRVASQQRRRARQRGSTVDLIGIESWMKEIRTLPFARCHWCGTKVKGRLICFDHVIPLSKGGSHTIGNLAASCRHCNSTKQAREIAKWICRGQTFLPI